MELQRRRVYANRPDHAHRALTLLAISVACGAAATPAVAQVSVEVSPLRVELKVGAGGTHTQLVQLRNDGSEPLRVHARIDDWYLSRDGTPQFKPVDPNEPFSAAAWVRLNPAEQVLAPRVNATLRFTTNVPAGTADGGYRTAIMFEFDPPGTDPSGRPRDVRFKSRIATVLYVTVGKPAIAVELTDLQVRTATGQLPQIVATLKNGGRASVRTKGAVAIYETAGNTRVRQLTVPEVPVLPTSEREVAIWTAGDRDDPLGPGEYRVEIRIDVGLPELLVGETTFVVAK